MQRLFIVAILSTVLYTAVPAAAQEPRTQDRLRTMEEVRRTEEAGEMAARAWSLANRLPRRIVQSNGSVIELVAVHDGRPYYLIPTNGRSASITGTSSLHPGGSLGLALAGEDLRIGVWDSGHVLANHVELSGRIETGDEAEVSSHATHVAGTLAAAGIKPQVRGMAFRADLKSYTWNNDATEMGNEAAAGLLLSNHSYGVLAGWHYGDLEDNGDRWYWLGDPGVSSAEDYMFGRYDVPAVQFDRIAHSHPNLLPVVAAGNDRLDDGPRSGSYRAYDANGNYRTYQIEQRPIPPDGLDDGFDTIAGAGTAKNVLTVGAVGYSSTTGTVRTSAFSSFGPTDDGRIKPDLAGVGEGVYSLSSTGSDAYGWSSGTSMSTPNVTGTLLLLQELHRDLFGTFMRASTLKGLALHTATDIDAPGPDYRTGWGLLNAEQAAEHVSSAVRNRAALIEAILEEGDQYVRDVSVTIPGDVRVTLSWTDPPSVRRPVLGSSSLDDPAPHLRNDLDVRLVHRSSGEVYRPYVLDRRNPGTAARRADNVVDPVEHIYVADADTGRYAVVVSHKGTLYADSRQAFSLVISGASADAAPVMIAHLEAEASLDGVVLRWRTLFEERPGTFVVERAPAGAGKSTNNDFQRVGELTIAGQGAREYSFVDDISVAGVYAYRISYRDGAYTFLAGSTQINLSAPDEYAVLSTYPNPFFDEATLVLDLPTTQHVTVDVFDVMGRKLASVHDGTLKAGRHRLPVRGDSWAPGVYLARVRTPSGSVVHRMIKQ